MERVRANIQTAKTLPPGGELYADRYEKAMRRTRELEPAYKAYDEGRKALAEKNLPQALAKVEQALKMFDGEAHFHALRGDIRFAEKNYAWAVTNYTRAISQRDSFFYYYLQRGLAQNQAGNKSAAIADLEASNARLQTAPAHYTLGTIAEERGETQKAIEHYRVIASDQSDYGKAASARLVRLDLAGNAAAYFSIACGVDDDQTLLVQIRNDAPIALRNIDIAVRLGNGRDVLRRISGPLASGGVGTVDTDIGPYVGGSCPARVTAAVAAE
jgi:tetratricopeptide (TPR) repeat protein